MPRSIECFMAANQAIKKSTFCLPVSTIIYPYLSISFHIYEVNRLDQRSIAILLMYLKYYDFIICMHELGNAWANCPVKPSDPKASKSWMLPFKDWNQWVLNLHKNDVYPCVSMYIHDYPCIFHDIRWTNSEAQSPLTAELQPNVKYLSSVLQQNQPNKT